MALVAKFVLSYFSAMAIFTSFLTLVCSTHVPVESHTILPFIRSTTSKIPETAQLSNPNPHEMSTNRSGLTTAPQIHSRQKRFLYKNIYGTFDVGVQAVIPYIIILPPVTNLFTLWRNKRSLQQRIGDNAIMDNEDHVLEDYVEDDDPVIQKHVDRINTYFELIQILEPACQQRAMCEFSANPSKYFPIAELFLSQLRAIPLEYLELLDAIKPNSTDASRKQKPTLFKMYSEAADHGLIQGHAKCHKRFANQCFYSTEQRLDMSVIQYWKVLESVLGLKIDDIQAGENTHQ